MNELVKKGFEWLERYWHKKLAAIIAPLIVSLVALWPFYLPESNQVGPLGWAVSFTVGLVALVVWVATNRLPRVEKGNVGIVLGILCDDPAADKQLKLDFVGKLRELVQQGGSKFQLIELPSWSLERMDEQAAMGKLLSDVRGHFLLYGRVRLRNRNGKPAHILGFEGIVRHRPVPKEISDDLQDDFVKTLPRKVIIEKENDAFSFEATSEWTEVSARYVIGTAALISGDFPYAENLFLHVQTKLTKPLISSDGIKQVANRLPTRFRQTYHAWLQQEYGVYFRERDRRHLVTCDEICSKLLKYQPDNPNGLLVKAICEFVLRRDIPASHQLLDQCKGRADATLWYSRAFLHAYQGKMGEAFKDYKRAFRGPIADNSIPVQCEEFIQIVLSEEPDRIQLHFCLGLINFYAKQDLTSAAKDFREFLAKCKEGKFAKQMLTAKNLLAECGVPTQI